MNIALLLIAFGFGFRIFAEADTNSKKLKSPARLVGLIIMAVSIIQVVSALLAGNIENCSGNKMSTYCPMHSTKKMSAYGTPYFVHPPISKEESQNTAPENAK